MTQDEFDRYVLPSYRRFPITIARGEGSYIYDDHGKKYLDFMSGWGVSNLGHRPKPVVDAITRQAQELIHAPNVFYFEPQGRLARMLVENSLGSGEGGEGKVFFSNSGAEANEAAIKFAKLYGGERRTIITAERSFHGRTAAAMAATGQDKVRKGFAPHLPAFKHVPFNDAAALRAAADGDTLAIMLELVQGEGGIHIATPEYAETIKQLCAENDILLIVDEVQSGMGRTGTLFAYQGYDGLEPDIITCAKALASGLPIGATIAGDKVARLVKPGMHGSTFGGGSLVAEAAIATLQEILKPEVQNHAAEVAELLSAKLAGLEKKHACIRQVRQKGLMIGIELDREAGPIVETCLKKGLYVNSTQGTTVRLLPPLTAAPSEVESAMSIIDEVLAESSGAGKSGQS